MTLTDKTARAQSAALTFELELKHSPQKVWRALTEPALLADWLLPLVKGRLELGADFTLQAQPFPDWDGTVQCRVLEMRAHERLSYTWVVGGMLDTVVTFELTPTAAGTRLSIVHSGFKPEQKQAFGGARYGWKLMGGKLIELLEKTS